MSKTKVHSAKAAPKSAAVQSSRTENFAPRWQVALVFLLPLALYLRTASFDFSYHDDDKMIVERGAALSKGIDFQTAFGTDAWLMTRGIELYRPWQSITYMFDYGLGGKSASLFHLHNALVFALGALLFFVFLRRIFPAGKAAFWGAAIYPLNFLFVHAACWVPARGDLWLFVFSMGCLIAWFDFLQKNGPALRSILINAACFFLALLAKESAIALLPVQGAMWYFFRKKSVDENAPERADSMPTSQLLIWAGLSLAGAVAWFLLRKNAIAVSDTAVSLAAVFANLRTIPEEVAKFVVPFGFSVMPDFSTLWTLTGTGVLAVLGWLVFSKKGQMRPGVLALGLALWLLPYLPSLAYKPHFAAFGYDYLDHRAFLILTGLWLILLEWADKSGFFEKKQAPALAIGIGAYFAVFSFWQSSAYQNWQAYYENATRTNPASALAASNMGTMLALGGKPDEALAWFEKAKKIKPDDTDTRVRICEMLVKLNRLPEAMSEAEFALSKNPKLLKALQFRGVCKGRMGKNEDALVDFKTAAELAPNDPENWRNIGFCLKDLNRHAEAVQPLSRAIEMRPDYADALFDRGFCYGFTGKFAEAKADLTKVIQLQPQNGPANYFRGRSNVSLGLPAEACADFKRAKELGVKEADNFLANGACQ